MVGDQRGPAAAGGGRAHLRGPHHVGLGSGARPGRLRADRVRVPPPPDDTAPADHADPGADHDGIAGRPIRRRAGGCRDRRVRADHLCGQPSRGGPDLACRR